MYRISVHPQALEETENAIEWYQRRSEIASDNFKSAIKKAFEDISKSPFIYTVTYLDIHVYHLKKFPYSIFYLVENQSIIVLAIFHNSRNPNEWKKRLK